MTLQFDFERLRLAGKTACAELLAERSAGGYWVGRLSSSPLATATAVSALVVAHDSDADVDVLSGPRNGGAEGESTGGAAATAPPALPALTRIAALSPLCAVNGT